jgi:hypothetical protein
VRFETSNWYKQQELRCDVRTRCACVLLACSTGYPYGPYKVLYVNGSSWIVHGLPNTTRIVTRSLSPQESVLCGLKKEFSPEVLHIFIYSCNSHWKLEGRAWRTIYLAKVQSHIIYLWKAPWKFKGKTRKFIYLATAMSYIIIYLWKARRKLNRKTWQFTFPATVYKDIPSSHPLLRNYPLKVIWKTWFQWTFTLYA